MEMAAAKSMDVVTFKKLLMDTEDYVVIRKKKFSYDQGVVTIVLDKGRRERKSRFRDSKCRILSPQDCYINSCQTM